MDRNSAVELPPIEISIRIQKKGVIAARVFIRVLNLEGLLNFNELNVANKRGRRSLSEDSP